MNVSTRGTANGNVVRLKPLVQCPGAGAARFERHRKRPRSIIFARPNRAPRLPAGDKLIVWVPVSTGIAAHP